MKVSDFMALLELVFHDTSLLSKKNFSSQTQTEPHLFCYFMLGMSV